MITARIVGAGLDPVNDSFVEFPDGQDDRFGDIEAQAAQLAASGTKCAIHWYRNTDGQSGYWGPNGVSMQPQWFRRLRPQHSKVQGPRIPDPRMAGWQKTEGGQEPPTRRLALDPLR